MFINAIIFFGADQDVWSERPLTWKKISYRRLNGFCLHADNTREQRLMKAYFILQYVYVQPKEEFDKMKRRKKNKTKIIQASSLVLSRTQSCFYYISNSIFSKIYVYNTKFDHKLQTIKKNEKIIVLT